MKPLISYVAFEEGRYVVVLRDGRRFETKRVGQFDSVRGRNLSPRMARDDLNEILGSRYCSENHSFRALNALLVAADRCLARGRRFCP